MSSTHLFPIGERLFEIASRFPQFSKTHAKAALRDWLADIPVSDAIQITDITNIHRIACRSKLLRAAKDLGSTSTETVDGNLIFRFPFACVKAVWDPKDRSWELWSGENQYLSESDTSSVRSTLAKILYAETLERTRPYGLGVQILFLAIAVIAGILIFWLAFSGH